MDVIVAEEPQNEASKGGYEEERERETETQRDRETHREDRQNRDMRKCLPLPCCLEAQHPSFVFGFLSKKGRTGRDQERTSDTEGSNFLFLFSPLMRKLVTCCELRKTVF